MADPERPNILVLLTDDHGQWASGCYGMPAIHTPAMDFLAATGTRMANAFTPCPVCSPARACFYTGRFPSQHGIHDWLGSDLTGEQHEGRDRDWLAGETTLYRRLAEVGYRIGHFGKWHCGADRVPKPGVQRWFAFWDGQGPHRGPWDYSDQGERVTLDGFKSRVITDRAAAWLSERLDERDGRPWLTYVGLIDTHNPHAGLPERLVSGYRAAANHVIGTHEPPEDFFATWAVKNIRRTPELQAQYFASVTAIDEQLGRLIDLLDARGELDSTLIIYASDHGLHAGQIGVWEKGNATRPLNLYERSVRVPMLLRYPRAIQAGQVRQEFVDHCDLFHTMLELAGAPLNEAERIRRRHAGQSFVPMLAGGSQPWRDAQFFEYGPVRGVRTATHKLLRRNGSFGPDELFDLTADPDERSNVIDDASNAAVVAELDRRINAFFNEIDEPDRSGLHVLNDLGLYNHNEPWDPRHAGYRFVGWPEE
ncbi:MAG: Choline-sulfatase [Phycisphaerae bacterium]|nr:Choline-sulfatase [Phycisphaerae bacterium]